MDRINLFVIMGVSGTGKTTIGKLLAKELQLSFFDGDDLKQVEWIKKRLGAFSRPILVNGDYIEASKKLNTRIYFDQRGVLVDRFGIKALPAIVKQEKRSIYVQQIKI